jgi:hypothetical protein
LPKCTVQLINPKPATPALTAALRRELITDATVMTANDAVFGVLQRCSRKDVVVAVVGDEECVAEVLFHVEVAGHCISCVSPWVKVAPNMFAVQECPTLIRTCDIKDCCIYAKRGANVQIAPLSRRA